MERRKLLNSCKNDVHWFINNFARSIGGATILDVGCGEGEYTRLFCRNANKVIGLDLRNRVKKEYANFQFVEGDATEVPFASNMFDYAVSFDVIEHVGDDATFLSEAYRVLKKGGKIFLETPNRERLSHKLMKLLGKPAQYPLKLGDDCVHIWEYTSEELENRFQKAGFKNIIVYPTWVGLRLKVIDIGLTRFPRWLNPVAQCWFVEAEK